MTAATAGPSGTNLFSTVGAAENGLFRKNPEALVVGKDGRPSSIRVRESLGMGLDERAIEAVTRWRFRAATLNGQPVATQIAVEVDFHLY